MRLRLERFEFQPDVTLGKLYVDGVYQCFILEDVVREEPGIPVAQWKVSGKTAIPTGTYNLIYNMSNRFKRNMFLLLNVPGFEGIRIHSGNTSADTEGCLLTGTMRTSNAVQGSKGALAVLELKVVPSIQRGEKVTVEIIGVP